MTPWRLIALAACLSILTSCAPASLAVKPPITVAPTPEAVSTFNEWLQALVAAYRDNCVALSVMRGEDTARCDPTR